MNNNTMNTGLGDAFCSLTNLQYFQANNAGLNGTLPDCMCNMQNMLYFYVSENALLTGPIPTCVGNMLNLRELHATCDNLNGTVPVGFNTLQYLTELRLDCNVNLDCTSDLSTRPNFIYLCGMDNCNCPVLPPTNCPINVTIPGCGVYIRQL